MADKFVGYGQKLRRGGAAIGDAYTDIPNSKDVKPPNVEAAEHNVFDNDSPDNADETIPGKVNYGECSAMCHYDPANAVHAALIADVGDRTKLCYWQILHSDTAGTLETFKGWIKKFERDEPTEGPLTGNLIIKVTSRPTFS